VRENTPRPELVRRVRFRWPLPPKRVIRDRASATGENLRIREEAGIRASMPVVDHEPAGPDFTHADFTYDADRDVDTCPQGEVLPARGNHSTASRRISQAPTPVGQRCPLRARGTDRTKGRRLDRHVAEAYRERARQYATTAADQKAMRKRQVWVEPLVGEANDWHGLRRFRFRGLDNVTIEGLRIAAGPNLKRDLAAKGWGRRQAPGGCLVALPTSGSPLVGAP
jgi:Transposase DDE domain